MLLAPERDEAVPQERLRGTYTPGKCFRRCMLFARPMHNTGSSGTSVWGGPFSH